MRERPGALGGELVPGEDDAPGVGPVEPTEQMQERRLAAAGAAEHRDDLAGVDLERHPVEHAALGAPDPERLDDATRFQDWAWRQS